MSERERELRFQLARAQADNDRLRGIRRTKWDRQIAPWQRIFTWVGLGGVALVLLFFVVFPGIRSAWNHYYGGTSISVPQIPVIDNGPVVDDGNGPAAANDNNGPAGTNGPGSITVDNGRIVFHGDPIRLTYNGDGLNDNANDISLSKICGRITINQTAAPIDSLLCNGHGFNEPNSLDAICRKRGLNAWNPYENHPERSPAGAQRFWYCG
jgi:hypothetical protein